MQRYYTGIGSRKTPAPVIAILTELAHTLFAAGYTLRSGAADGADAAFEAGAGGLKDVFLPWAGFNKSTSALTRVCDKALHLAESLHPAWPRLSGAAKKLHARNTYQVLGLALDAPSDFLVCWTPDGLESAEERTSQSGGTATAVVLAQRHRVPVFNLKKPGRAADLSQYLKTQGIDWPVPESLKAPIQTTLSI